MLNSLITLFCQQVLLNATHCSMLLSLLHPPVKTTVFSCQELLLAQLLRCMILTLPSDRYFELFHHPLQLSDNNQSFCTVLYHLQNLLQLGIFRKTSIAGQFRLDWLRSSYKTFEWGYSVDFLRIEGYQPGKLCSWIVCYAWKEYQRFVFAKSTCFSSAFFFTGTKIKLFDTTPTQFVALAPNIWSWPMWKAGIFMHHDVSILEQVS